VSVQAPAGAALWAAEPSAVAGHARIRARIAGLHCSLCTGTIEKALGRLDGVGQVAVSLTHEQALVDYDPGVIAPEWILATLRDIGYELYDPRKLRPFEEEEAALVREGVRLLAAICASLTAIGLIATVAQLGRQGSALAGRGRPLVADLGQVSFMDAAGLRGLGRAAKQAAAHSGKMHVVCGRPQILRLFQLTGLDDRVSVTHTLADALESLHEGPDPR